MAAAAILKITNKSQYICNSLTDLYKIWYGDGYWSIEPDVKLKF